MERKVYIVGTGPGDPGLITHKGLELLKIADVILYDDLIPHEILIHCKEEAEIIPVGKRRNITQEQINYVMEQKAKEGKIVVRLKGGDPFIFGRGGEEAEYLVEKGIDVEIVPGVSSLYAVPAYAGIPLTHRRFSSCFCAATCHEDPNKDQTINWDSIAQFKGTIVLFMGAKNAKETLQRLLSIGMDPETPIAAITWGTTTRQKVIEGKLKEMLNLTLMSPSLIVIGKVCNLRRKLNWFEKRPLLGKEVLLVTCKEEGLLLSEFLREKGAKVFVFPVLRYEPKVPKRREIEKMKGLDFLAIPRSALTVPLLKTLDHLGVSLKEGKLDILCPADSEVILFEKGVSYKLWTDVKKDGLKGRKIGLPLRDERASLFLQELGAEVFFLDLLEITLSGKNIAKIVEEQLNIFTTFIFGDSLCFEAYLRRFGEKGANAIEKKEKFVLPPFFDYSSLEANLFPWLFKDAILSGAGF